MKELTKAQLAKKFDFLSSKLDGKKFLMGDQYTVADPYLFTVLNWGAHTGVDLAKWPALLGHQERVRSRPAVQAALKHEGLIK